MLNTIDNVVELARRLRAEGVLSVSVGNISLTMYPDETPVKLPVEQAEEKEEVPAVDRDDPSWRGHTQQELFG